MNREFKAAILSGLVLTLIGFMDLTPVQLGKSLSFSTVAEASEWSEGILRAVYRLHAEEGQAGAIGPIEIRLDDGSFPMNPKARIRDIRGIPISLEELIVPCKIRFILEKGVIKEMVFIEALPR